MPNIRCRDYSDHTVGTIHLRGGENPETTFTYGTEDELEPANGQLRARVTSQQAMEAVYEIMGENVYFKRDASLDGDALEMISEPCSLAYHTYSMRWKWVMKTLVKSGYRSHDTRNCGLHVHVGRAQLGRTDEERDAVIRKAKIWLARNWDDVVRFTRRRRDELDRWASRPYMDGLETNDTVSAERWERLAQLIPTTNTHAGRYTALNCDTRNPTIEFRIFKGTLKRDTYIATLQFCDELLHWCQRATWEEVRRSSFLTPFEHSEFPELRAYLATRGLMSAEQVGTLRRTPEFTGPDGVVAVA